MVEGKVFMGHYGAIFSVQVIMKLYCSATKLFHCQYIGCSKNHVGMEIMIPLFSVCTLSGVYLSSNIQHTSAGFLNISPQSQARVCIIIGCAVCKQGGK